MEPKILNGWILTILTSFTIVINILSILIDPYPPPYDFSIVQAAKELQRVTSTNIVQPHGRPKSTGLLRGNVNSV